MITKRRAVAPVIATLLMVAIAVVGGMLVFVFAQDFFTQTESMTGPTIEQLQIYGYDARDISNGKIRSHSGYLCVGNAAATGTMADGDHGTFFVRNHGSVPVTVDQVFFFGGPGVQTATASLAATVPAAGTWGIVDDDAACTDTTLDSPILPGQERTIIYAWDSDFCDPTCEPKAGRPIFVSLTTDAGNVFTKTLINGRSIG